MDNNTFWEAVADCGRRIRKTRTVDEAITALQECFPNPNFPNHPDNAAEPYADPGADAFFPGGGGDDGFYDMLDDAGWKIVWADADYFFVAHDHHGQPLTYIEGDVYRGDRRN